MPNFETTLQDELSQEYPIETYTSQPEQHPEYHESSETNPYAVAGVVGTLTVLLVVGAAYLNRKR